MDDIRKRAAQFERGGQRKTNGQRWTDTDSVWAVRDRETLLRLLDAQQKEARRP